MKKRREGGLSSPKDGSPYRVEVLEKALDIVDMLRGSNESFRLADIVRATRLDKSTTFRILHTLQKRGYLLRDLQTKRFQLSRGFRNYRIGYAAACLAEPFCKEVTSGLEEAARGQQVELLVVDNDFSAEKALANADWLIRQRPDFVVEYQLFYRVAPQLADVFEKAHIPTMAIDIPQPGAIFFGVNNYAAGWMGGEALGRFAQREWHSRVDRVLLLELPQAGRIPQSRIIGMLRGIQHVLPHLRDRSVLHRDAQGTDQGAYMATRRVLRSVSPTERLLIGALYDSYARGALRAVREKGRERFTAIMGQGWDPHPLLTEEIRRGDSPIIGTVAYFPEKYGAKVLASILKCLGGQQVPPAVYTEHALVTRENIDQLLGARVHLPGRPEVFGVSTVGPEPLAKMSNSTPDGQESALPGQPNP